MRFLLRAALLRLARWAVLRRGRHGAGAGTPASPPPPRRLRLAGAPPGVGFYAVGRTVLLSRGEEDGGGGRRRRWRILRPTGTGGAVLAKTHLSDRVAPSDFGLPCAVVADADGVKHFYGAGDSLDDVLRQ